MRTLLRWPRLSLAVLVGVACAALACDDAAQRVSGEWAGDESAASRAGYQASLVEATRAVANAERLVAASPESWIRRGQLAARHLRLAKLTGSYESYARADAAVEEAFQLGGGQLGPNLIRAQLNFALHRFDRVESDLAVAERLAVENGDATTQSQILALRGSLAMGAGRYMEASDLFLDAMAVAPTFEAIAGLADFHAKTGDRQQARDLYREASSLLGEDELQSRAWVELQLGELALVQGELAEARAHFSWAEARFPGWWLIGEHLAELDALEGQGAAAIANYEALVAETGDPELMAALAMLLEAKAPRRATRLIARAGEVYEERSLRFPEATCGHALHFQLAHGADATYAIELAQKNYALRPNGESATLLAKAYLKAGRLAQARELLATTTETLWRSADTHDTYATVLEQLGDADGARRQQALAAQQRSGD